MECTMKWWRALSCRTEVGFVASCLRAAFRLLVGGRTGWGVMWMTRGGVCPHAVLLVLCLGSWGCEALPSSRDASHHGGKHVSPLCEAGP